MASSRHTEGSSDRTSVFVAPLDGVLDATLELLRPPARVTVRATAIDALCRATFDGRRPRAWADGGFVGVAYPRFRVGGLTRANGARIELSSAVPWLLVVAGGLRDSSFALDRLELAGIVLQGGAVNLDVVLPRPRGLVPVRIEGGASRVRILRPAGVAARLRVGHGASRLTFDDERYGAIGGETRLETPNAGDGADRYEIEVEGGASRLTVGERGGGAES